MKSIFVTEARLLVADVRRLKPSCVLSIEHPGASGDAVAPRLHGVGIDIPQMIQVYWDTEDAYPGGPDMNKIREGLEFLQSHGGTPMIHCRQGKSRSVAMALTYLVASNPDADIETCIAHLKTLRPDPMMIAPNIRSIAFADLLLKKRDALLMAVLSDPQIDAARAQANAARKDFAEKNPGLFRPGKLSL